MVRPGEGTLAEVALEGTVAGVLAKVACELVTASEFPSTALPVAVIWLFTCVCPVMGLEVGALGVSFATASEGTGVRGSALSWPGSTPSLGLGVQKLQWR